MDRREFLAAAAIPVVSGFSRTDPDRTNSMQSVYRLTPDTNGHTLVSPVGQTVLGYLTSKPAGSNLLARSVCCFHPLNTPAGERVTDFAPKDHPHHRGVFLAWHSMEFRRTADFSKFGPTGPTHGFDINRADFWGWGQFAPVEGRVITNRGVRLVRSDAESAELEIRNDWTINDTTYLAETTTAFVRQTRGVNLLDLTYRLTPDWDLTLNQTAFGGFCARLRADGESWYADPHGKVTRPDPHYSVPDLNWPAAPWYAYAITLAGGKTVGCAVLDHPSNPPSTWHNPRYVWMVNPCVVADKPFTAPRGRALTLRYRVVAFDGAPSATLLNALADEWRGAGSR